MWMDKEGFSGLVQDMRYRNYTCRFLWPKSKGQLRKSVFMKWISVFNQMPPPNVWVLVLSEGTMTEFEEGNIDYHFAAKFDPRKGWNRRCTAYDEDPQITHWMPLPLSPDEMD